MGKQSKPVKVYQRPTRPEPTPQAHSVRVSTKKIDMAREPHSLGGKPTGALKYLINFDPNYWGDFEVTKEVFDKVEVLKYYEVDLVERPPTMPTEEALEAYRVALAEYEKALAEAVADTPAAAVE